MAVIRLFPSTKGCRICGSPVDLPHRDEAACCAALVKEMDTMLKRARQISVKGRTLTRKRLTQLDARGARKSSRAPRRG